MAKTEAGRYSFETHPARDAELSRLRRLVDLYEAKTECLIRSLSLPPAAEILDVGCGLGGPLHQLASHTTGTVYGLDRSKELLRQAQAAAVTKGLGNIRFIAHDMCSLPFPDASFDLVFSRFAVKHVFDPAGSVREMVRTLRRKGTLCVIDKDMLAGACLWHPAFPLRGTSLLRAINLQNEQPHRGGNSSIGRMLKSLFVANHVEVRSVDVEVCPIAGSDSTTAEVHRENFMAVYRNNIPLLVSQGLIQEAEANRDLDMLEAFLMEPTHFAATVTFTVVGVKKG